MKLKKKKKPLEETGDIPYSIEEQNRVVAFMQLLIKIDRRLGICAQKESKIEMTNTCN